MPRGDRTGPMGMGPMTGRAAGFCAGYGVPGYANPFPRWGFGPWGWGGRCGPGWGGGWGRGFRWRRWFYATGVPGWARWGLPPFAPVAAPPAPEQEVEMLREEAEWLKEQLEAINRRIADLEKEKGGE